MKPIEWTKDLEIGVEPIDYDHRMLIGCINELGALIEAKEATSVAQTKRTINFLASYVRYHFEREEKFMVALDFKPSEAHAHRHREFSDWVDLLDNKYKKNPESVDLEDVRTQLINWLINHILKEDILLKEIAQQNPDKVKEIIVNLV